MQKKAAKQVLQFDEDSDSDGSLSLHDDSDDSSLHIGQEEEDELCQEERLFDTIIIGDFVKIFYEGEYFPGVVQVKNKDSAQVSVLSMAGVNRCK